MISASFRTTAWCLILIATTLYVVPNLIVNLPDYALLDSRLHALIGFFAVVFSALAHKALTFSGDEDEHFLIFSKRMQGSESQGGDNLRLLLGTKKILIHYHHVLR